MVDDYPVPLSGRDHHPVRAGSARLRFQNQLVAFFAHAPTSWQVKNSDGMFFAKGQACLVW